MSLFTGVFQAKEAGPYTWEARGNDNRSALWIDLDQDGSFESLGDLGSEKVIDVLSPNADATVNLRRAIIELPLHGENRGVLRLSCFSAPSSSSWPNR